VAVSKKHNAAEPSILAGGIAYQNWALKSPASLCQQRACQVLIPEPRCKHGRRGLLRRARRHVPREVDEQSGQGALRLRAGDHGRRKAGAGTFALVSSLAGCRTVVDLMRSQSTEGVPPSNYVHLDPWRPPTAVRRLKPRRDGCEFCCDPKLKAVLASLWDLPAAT
jgi:hypothetical protein